MRVMKTAVQLRENGAIMWPDTIEFQGGLWFVVEWIECHDEKWRMPAKIVRMDLLPHQRLTDGPHDYYVSEPISEDALFGRSQPPKDPRLEVIENPDIRFPISNTH